MLMPEKASNSAGTCAAILAISPVILLAPAAPSLPVETIVFRQRLDALTLDFRLFQHGCDQLLLVTLNLRFLHLDLLLFLDLLHLHSFGNHRLLLDVGLDLIGLVSLRLLLLDHLGVRRP